MNDLQLRQRLLPRHCTARRIAHFDRDEVVRRLFAQDGVHGDFRIVEQVAYPSAESWFDVASDGHELFVSVLYWEAGEYFGTGEQRPADIGAGNHCVEVMIGPCGDQIGFLQFGAGPGDATWSNHHWPYRDGRADLTVAPDWSASFHFEHLKADLAWVVCFRFALDAIRQPGYNGPIGFNVMRTQLRHNESATWNTCTGSGFPDATSCGWLLLDDRVPPPAPAQPASSPAVKLHGTYDWPDEMVGGPYTPDTLRHELRFLKSHGMSRVYFLDYPGRESWGPGDSPVYARMAANYRLTREAFGGDIMAVACRLAHEEGLEFFTIAKPYDLGAGERFPREHPELCFRRNPAWMGATPSAPITELTLYGDSDAPLPFDPAAIRLLISDDNRDYQPVTGLTVRDEVVERPHAAYTPAGNQPLTGTNRVRRLRLSGFALTGRHAAIVFPAGEGQGCFGNRDFLLAEAAYPVGLHRSIRGGDFRANGFDFAQDGGSACWADRSEGMTFRRELGGSVLGVRFGHEPYHVPMLDPSHPQVRAFWLDHWIRRAIAAGADGVDIRIAHHHGNAEWLAYMYAEPVLAAFRERHDREPEPTVADYAAIRRLRGEFHTRFLRDAKALLGAAGKRLEVHVEARMKTPPEHDTYTQIHWDWASWIDEGIVDGINLKYLAPGNPFVEREILPRCRRRGIPVHAIAAVGDPRSQPRTAEWAVERLRLCRAGGLDALNLYELWVYLRTTPDGDWFTRGSSRAIFAALKDAIEAP